MEKGIPQEYNLDLDFKDTKGKYFAPHHYIK